MARFQVLASVVVFIVAAACGTAGAEPTHPNEIGLYTNSDGTGDTGTYLIGEPVELFLVLTRPIDVLNGNMAYTIYSGFDLRMTFDPLPADNLMLLGVSLLGDPLDVGIKDFAAGYLEFVCGLAVPVPVVDDVVSVGALTFVNRGTQVTKVFLGPVTGGFPIPTEMRYAGAYSPTTPLALVPMYPVSGGHDAAVFEFNGAAVQTDIESFGSVKALYR